MLLSKNWLKDFVDLPNSASEIVAALTMKTVEVEKIVNLAKDLDKVVVGQITEVSDHPNADALRVCQVSVGGNSVQIVCGGSNLELGMLVALAMVGAKVRWHGEGELVELGKAKLRGVESFGMICSSDEIGLSGVFPKGGEKEILDLSYLKVKPGTKLSAALGIEDIVFDIDNKSMTHRGDLWGHLGMARELSAIFDKKLKEPKPAKIKSGKSVKLSVDVADKDLCPRYMALAIENIKIGPSPDWLQKRLLSVGIGPINNIVDITNYVMQELGQPMHAFDADKVSGGKSKKIIVRRAKNGEKLTTLDKKDYKLNNKMLVIADPQKALALAGVMGGEDSKINNDTNTVIFESAVFEASCIRHTSTKLGLRSDSSTRFEKSLDPSGADITLQRAVELVLQIIPGARVASAVVDRSNYQKNRKPISISLDTFEKKLGKNIPKKDILNILKRLGFAVKASKNNLSVAPPSWRTKKDISIPEDLVEEVARIYGYENIPSTLPSLPITSPAKNNLRYLERKVKELLAFEFGFTEVYNYSFVSPELLDMVGEDKSLYMQLDNPVAKDKPYLRRHLVLGLLPNVEENLHRFDSVRLFEIGKVYTYEQKGEKVKAGSKSVLPQQNTQLAIAFAQKGAEIPFYEVANAIRGVFDRLGIEIKLKKARPEGAHMVHSGRYAEILVGDVLVGRIAELNPVLQNKFGIPHRTAILELELNYLTDYVGQKENYTKLPNFPSVYRDLAFTVDRDVEHESVALTIKNVDNLIVGVELFDVYIGGKIESGKKSMAYHIVYRSPDKTLEAKDIDKLHEKVVSVVEQKFNAIVRK